MPGHFHFIARQSLKCQHYTLRGQLQISGLQESLVGEQHGLVGPKGTGSQAQTGGSRAGSGQRGRNHMVSEQVKQGRPGDATYPLRGGVWSIFVGHHTTIFFSVP